MQKKSLYVHIPFCVSKCLFCSFAISVGQAHRVDDYIFALGEECKQYQGLNFSTVYLGGGTPTFLNDEQISQLAEHIRRYFIVDPNAEWTIEANPEHLNLSKAKFLKKTGFNRLSLGTQTFEDRYLKFLGRNHDCSTALSAYQAARDAGFNNINVDLMFSYPGQTEDEIRKDIQTLGQLKSEHVSLYGLTIDEKSRFYAQQLKLDDQELLAKQYVLICQLLEEQGLSQYEVSNFCRAGREAVHNSNYWNGSQYIGLGMGAHSYVDEKRYWNVSKLQDYLARIQKSGNATEDFENLTAETRLMERVLFGLRKNEGIQLSYIEREVGLRLVEEKLSTIESFIEAGFLVNKNDRLMTTMKGRLVLDELCSRLI